MPGGPSAGRLNPKWPFPITQITQRPFPAVPVVAYVDNHDNIGTGTSVPLSGLPTSFGTVIIAKLLLQSNKQPTLSPGWQVLVPSGVDANGQSNHLWGRVCDGTSLDTPTVTWDGASINFQATLFRYTGASATNPFDNTGNWQSNVSGTTALVPGFTTNQDKELIILVANEGNGLRLNALAGWVPDFNPFGGPHNERNTTIAQLAGTAISDATFTYNGGSSASLTRMIGLSPTPVVAVSVAGTLHTLSLLGAGPG